MAYQQYPQHPQPQYQQPVPPPGPYPPQGPSNRGPVIAAVAIAGVLLLLVVGAVVIVVFSRAALPVSSDDPPGAEYDGVWAGMLTQYGEDDEVHGTWEVEFVLADGEVTRAEETSDDFGYDRCVWEPRDVEWTPEELSFHYTVTSTAPADGTCAPTGELAAWPSASGTSMEVMVTIPGLAGHSQGFVFLGD